MERKDTKKQRWSEQKTASEYLRNNLKKKRKAALKMFLVFSRIEGVLEENGFKQTKINVAKQFNNNHNYSIHYYILNLKFHSTCKKV